ncbi:MAG: TIGR02678 family protein [Nocardioidaceae bacterium]|jgi:uncharacterized protein (TIGR02678 family)|nr:TIGR02678 family protein [Nocardioidaceae bacterium]
MNARETAHLATVVEARHAEDQERAARVLLAQPLLRSTGPTSQRYRLVRRHADALRRWFETNAGWRLHVDSQVIRLRKVPPLPSGTGSAAEIAGTHPARARRADPPFTRRRYVLACLCLAVLERSEQQVSLGRLAEQVVMAAQQSQLDGIDVTLAAREDRADLAAVIRLLLELGALVRVAGDEDSFVRSDGDALYDVERRVLATLLVTRHGPSLVARASDGGRPPDVEELEQSLHEQGPAFTDDETNRRLRHALTRRLLEDPVVYHDELSDAERAYLSSQRTALVRRISELTGLHAEVRAEGIAMVDPLDALTDVRMPDTGTEGHVTLLVAEHLAGHTGSDDAGGVPKAEMHALVRRLAAEHAPYWRRSAQEPGAETALIDAAVRRLQALGLATVVDGRVVPRPALARFAVGAPILRSAVEPARSLLDTIEGPMP